MSEQTATRFQDLLDLLNLQDEDGATPPPARKSCCT